MKCKNANNILPSDIVEMIQEYIYGEYLYIPMAETFVYEDKEGIKGFISIINDEFIGALFVATKYQGSGIGKQLIDYAINKYNKLNLAVYKDNKKSVEFYINRGFKILEKQANEDSGYDEYIMNL